MTDFSRHVRRKLLDPENQVSGGYTSWASHWVVFHEGQFRCHMCRGPTDETHYCFGCGTHVCESCDINFCVGKHVPIDHFRQMPGEYHG